LFFEIDNSEPTIKRALRKFKRMRVKGKQTVIVAVHDSIVEVRDWRGGNGLFPVYFITKIDFYRNFYCAVLPVFVRINRGKVKGFKYFSRSGGIE
jgi:hypothetical protein